MTGKRARKNYVGNLYKHSELKYGKRVEKLQVINPLLPEGTIVTMWDIGIFTDGHAAYSQGSEDALEYKRIGKVREHTYLRPPYGCIDVHGNVKKYIIETYTHGIQFPLHRANRAILTRVIDGHRVAYDSTSIPTLYIATGSTILLTENEKVERLYENKYILKDKERFPYLT